VSASWVHTAYPQQVHFGAGAVNRLAQVLKDAGARSWMLVTSPGRLGSDDGRRVVQLLGRALTSTFAEVAAPLRTDTVEGAVRQARRDAVEGVVSFGGAACADLAKAICFFAEHEAGTPGVSHADRPVVPHVAVPTTYAPCFLLPSFAMTDAQTRRTREAAGPTLAPVAAICDPDVVVTGPGRPVAASGMVAIATAVEAAGAAGASPEARALAVAAAERAAAVLPYLANDPADPSARGDMLAATVMAGRARQNAEPGLHHVLSVLVAGRCGIAYAPVAAVLLPHVMRFNSDAAPAGPHRLGAALGDPDDPPGAVERMLERLGLPLTLMECGVDPLEFDTVAALAAGDPAMRTNPRPAGEADARAILEGAC
jgi:alcohol dehydrogenase class IV